MKKEIDNLILEITEEFKKLEDILEMDNCILMDAIKLQAPLRMKWEYYAAMVHSVKASYEQIVEEEFSVAFRELLNDYNKDLSSTEAKIYAQSSPRYVQAKKDYNSILPIIRLTDGALRALDDLKWNLKNQTELVIRGADGYII